MFHKNKTDVERRSLLDAYMLSILKEREVIKKNRKIIQEKGFSYDPTINEDKIKGAFNSYVDSLVIKNFSIEQIYTRLKINKTMATQFVNKLDGNQVLILSKVIHEFIKDIQDKYVSINDYILKTSFDETQGTYNVLGGTE
jgi:predicted transcriptional regulator